MSDDDVVDLRLDNIEKRLDRIDGWVANGFKAFLAGTALLLWEPLKAIINTLWHIK
jgi:hypothetical protein